MKFTREEFYDLVWSKPLSNLAEEYNISDNGIRKKCNKYNIPLPPQGYWQRIKSGRKCPKIKLPIQNDKVHIVLENRLKNLDSNVSQYWTKYYEIQNDIEKSIFKDFNYPERLVQPNVLTKRAKQDLKYQASLPKKNEQVLLHTSPNILSIKVSEQTVNRALLFFDIFIKLVYLRGHKIEVIDDYTIINIGGEKLTIWLQEPLHRHENIDHPYLTKYLPSGKLSLRLTADYTSKNWTDNGKQKIEDQLGKILTYLEMQSFEIKRNRDLSKQREEKYEAERQAELQRKSLIEKEISELRNLIALAERFDLSKKINQFVMYAEDIEDEKLQPNEEKIGWINWSKDKARWIDPLSPITEDHILGEFSESILKKILQS